ncbi:unnamed protein product [Anisakis simplex]|uniref:NikA protein n=1 Tax=Anisakis simplex TaxID=6269 RepID=A0A0M3KK34_ANISI|nr:unnamed protein product [Anisakis simplex]
MRECMSKVKVRTPAERAEIERFCAEVLRRRVKLLMQTGYTEKVSAEMILDGIRNLKQANELREELKLEKGH